MRENPPIETSTSYSFDLDLLSVSSALNRVADLNATFRHVSVPPHCQQGIQASHGIVSEAEQKVKSLQERESELQLVQNLILMNNRMEFMAESLANMFNASVCRVHENSPFNTEFQHFDAIGCKYNHFEKILLIPFIISL